MKASLSVVTLVVLGGVARSAWADFTPGHVYVSDHGPEPCAGGPYPNDRIWDINPVTGAVSLFVEVPDEICGFMTGLAFSPDGAHLRASVSSTWTVLEFDPSAGISVGLDSRDGIISPAGSNNIAYDSAGNFYVMDLIAIRKFPPDGGPATILAEGVTVDSGPIAVLPDGDVLYGFAGLGSLPPTLYRVAPDGAVTVFDSIFAHSIAVSSAGDVFVLSGNVYRYPAGDPGNRELVAENFTNGAFSASMTLSPDESSLYVANATKLFGVNLSSGSVAELATIPGPYASFAGAGIAVYVPEPTTIVLLLAGMGLLGWRRRETTTVSRPYAARQ